MVGNNDKNKPKKEMLYNENKPSMERLVTIAAKLTRIVKRYETTRPVLTAAAFPELSSRLGFFDSFDLIGYNYKEQFYEADHKRFPRLPILGSENSHSLQAWQAVTDREYISGQFLWTGIDFLGEAHDWPIRGSLAGLLDSRIATHTPPRRRVHHGRLVIYALTECGNTAPVTLTVTANGFLPAQVAICG
jgi:hypothetical protein